MSEIRTYGDNGPHCACGRPVVFKLSTPTLYGYWWHADGDHSKACAVSLHVDDELVESEATP